MGENNEITKSDVQLQLQNIDGVDSVEEDGVISISADEMNSEIATEVLEDEKETMNDNVDIITSMDDNDINEDVDMNDNIPPSDDNDKENEDESSSFSLSSISRMVSSLLLAVIAVVSVHVF